MLMYCLVVQFDWNDPFLLDYFTDSSTKLADIFTLLILFTLWLIKI